MGNRSPVDHISGAISKMYTSVCGSIFADFATKRSLKIPIGVSMRPHAGQPLPENILIHYIQNSRIFITFKTLPSSSPSVNRYLGGQSYTCVSFVKFGVIFRC